MLLLVGAFIASMIPCVVIFFWLRSLKGMGEGYPGLCNKAALHGVLTVLPVILCSGSLHLLGIITGLAKANPYVYQFYYTFCVLAFSEELCKFLMMRRVIKDGNYSQLTITIVMALVGLGFEVIEAIPYAIGSGPQPMLMRGLTMMHIAFGFIMGYFYGKSVKEKKKTYAVIGFLLAWGMHGMYDFCISEEMLALEWPGYLALGLAGFSAVLVIIFVIYVIRTKKAEESMESTESAAL